MALEKTDLNLDENDEEGYTGPVKFSLKTVPSNRVHDTKQHMAPVLERLKPINEELTRKSGSIEHKFEVDGVANICFTVDASETVLSAVVRQWRF